MLDCPARIYKSITSSAEAADPKQNQSIAHLNINVKPFSLESVAGYIT
jgi:hypothetical protein